MWRWSSGGFEPDGADEGVEIVGDTLVEVVELRSLVGLESAVCIDGSKQACGEWRVDALEEFEEDEADRITVRKQLISTRIGNLGNEFFGAQLGEIVAERGQRVGIRFAIECREDVRIDVGGCEGVAGGDMSEAHESMHEGELAGLVEL